MFVQRIIYKKEAKEEWKEGWYVGKEENSNKSVVLTADYDVVEGDLWDCKPSPNRYLFDIPEPQNMESDLRNLNSF